MLHKTKSIAEEKKLLREIKVSQTGAVDPCLSMKKLNSRVRLTFEIVCDLFPLFLQIFFSF